MKIKFLFFIIVVALSKIALAQVDDFDIIKSTIDGGGGLSSGGEFSIQGTIGQADATTALSGGDFSLIGGFWEPLNDDLIFINGFD